MNRVSAGEQQQQQTAEQLQSKQQHADVQRFEKTIPQEIMTKPGVGKQQQYSRRAASCRERTPSRTASSTKTEPVGKPRNIVHKTRFHAP